MSDAHAFAVGQLRSFIERVERVEEEIKTLNDDKSDIYKEIRSAGFDVKTVRKIVAKRKLADDVRHEQDTLFDTYWEALTGSSLVHVHTRENIEQFDPLTGEFLDHAPVTIIDQTDADGHHIKVTVDPQIAAILARTDDAPRSDGGLDIVTKHTEIASASQGEADAHSDQRETDREAAATGVGANEGGEDVESSAERAGLEGGPVNLEPSGPEAERATSFTARPPSPLRPHCRQPEACGGYGRNHCHTCAKAMREREPQEELA